MGGSDDDDWGSSDEDWVAQQQEAKTPGRSAAAPPPSPQRRIRPTNIRPGLAASTKVNDHAVLVQVWLWELCSVQLMLRLFGPTCWDSLGWSELGQRALKQSSVFPTSLHETETLHSRATAVTAVTSKLTHHVLPLPDSLPYPTETTPTEGGHPSQLCRPRTVPHPAPLDGPTVASCPRDDGGRDRYELCDVC